MIATPYARCDTCGRPSDVAYLLPSPSTADRVVFDCGRHPPADATDLRQARVDLSAGWLAVVGRLRQAGYAPAADLLHRSINASGHAAAEARR